MIKSEPYNFQNIYIITTYRCNWNCEFCLFRFNGEIEASLDEIISKIEYSIKDSKKKVYLKITGGEPFLKKKLLKRIFELSNFYRDKIYKIGIGTNGSIRLPEFFNDLNIRTNIFLSRHNIKDNLLYPNELGRNIDNSLIDFRINCNLINGSVDSLEKIEEYIIEKYTKYRITHFCFRELSKVNVDINSMYPKQIYDYINYYNKNVIFFTDIEKKINKNNKFSKSRITGNYYDLNHWYWYKNCSDKISVKFRMIDETKLIDFNKNRNPNDIDEYVIHPDGTLTGCWDKELKIIFKGDKNA
jgi:organic radical activating enzyme